MVLYEKYNMIYTMILQVLSAKSLCENEKFIAVLRLFNSTIEEAAEYLHTNHGITKTSDILDMQSIKEQVLHGQDFEQWYLHWKTKFHSYFS